MAKAQSKHDESGDDGLDEVTRIFKEAQTMMKEKRVGCKNDEVKIAVTGFSGVGKSCFINAIRGYGSFIDNCRDKC